MKRQIVRASSYWLDYIYMYLFSLFLNNYDYEKLHTSENVYVCMYDRDSGEKKKFLNTCVQVRIES